MNGQGGNGRSVTLSLPALGGLIVAVAVIVLGTVSYVNSEIFAHERRPHQGTATKADMDALDQKVDALLLDMALIKGKLQIE